MAHIVNLRHAPALRAALNGKAEHGGTVRIDRRSQWGNRFRIGPDGRVKLERGRTPRGGRERAPGIGNTEGEPKCNPLPLP